MKFIHYINKNAALAVSACLMAGAAMGMLTACKEYIEVPVPVYTVGEAANPIVLSAGISEGGSGVQTRATRAGEPDANHNPSTEGGGHKLLKSGTYARLRVYGIWKKTSGDATEVICKTTTIQIGDKVSDSGNNALHNKITSYSPQLYWDDYGTADPANTAEGRAKGLTIYGVTVDGYEKDNNKCLPTCLGLDENQANWNNLSWKVTDSEGTPSVVDQTSGWGDYDLLTSNNIREGADGTLKFDEVLDKDRYTLSNLLEFTHAMTKITVNLTAGDGFQDAEFQSAPKVTLLGFNYTGTVNVETKVSTPTASTTTNINAHLANVKDQSSADWGTVPNPWVAKHMAQFDALVFPGNTFSDNVDILKIEADGNIYYVNATKINVANQETNNKFEQAKNYIFNVTIKKTGIEINATVTDWLKVEAETVQPEIKVSTVYSASGDVSPSGFNSFSFYRSVGNPLGSSNIETGYGFKEGSYYAAEAVATGTLGTSPWEFRTLDKSAKTHLYWPSHSIHYHMRGVWPETVTTADGDYDWKGPRVSTVSDVDNTQVIRIKNVGYAQNTFPSDLLIGAPVFTNDNKECNNETHDPVDQSVYGICATQGTVTLNFRYQMAQVEVHLSTSGESDYDHVELTNADVDILQCYTEGYVTLGESCVEGENRRDYRLGTCNTTNVSDSVNIRRSAIVPQALSFEVSPNDFIYLMFKITIKNSSGDTDVYTIPIKSIKVAGNTIDSWEQGKRYIYNLKILKTKIDVTATLTNWKTVNASEDVWF